MGSRSVPIAGGVMPPETGGDVKVWRWSWMRTKDGGWP